MATKNNAVVPESDKKLQTEQQVYSCHPPLLQHSCRIIVMSWDAWPRCYDNGHVNQVVVNCNEKTVNLSRVVVSHGECEQILMKRAIQLRQQGPSIVMMFNFCLVTSCLESKGYCFSSSQRHKSTLRVASGRASPCFVLVIFLNCSLWFYCFSSWSFIFLLLFMLSGHFLFPLS